MLLLGQTWVRRVLQWYLKESLNFVYSVVWQFVTECATISKERVIEEKKRKSPQDYAKPSKGEWLYSCVGLVNIKYGQWFYLWRVMPLLLGQYFSLFVYLYIQDCWQSPTNIFLCLKLPLGTFWNKKYLEVIFQKCSAYNSNYSMQHDTLPYLCLKQ